MPKLILAILNFYLNIIRNCLLSISENVSLVNKIFGNNINYKYFINRIELSLKSFSLLIYAIDYFISNSYLTNIYFLRNFS